MRNGAPIVCRKPSTLVEEFSQRIHIHSVLFRGFLYQLRNTEAILLPADSALDRPCADHRSGHGRVLQARFDGGIAAFFWGPRTQTGFAEFCAIWCCRYL